MRTLCVLLLAGTHPRWAAGFYPHLSSAISRFHEPSSQHFVSEPATHWVVSRWSFPRRRSAAAAAITTTTTTTGSSGSRSTSEATMRCGLLPRYGGAEASIAPAAAGAAVPWTQRGAGIRMLGVRTCSSLRASSRTGSVEHTRCFQGEGGDTAAAGGGAADAETTASGANGVSTAVASSRLLLGEEDFGDSTAAAHEYLRDFLGMTDEVRRSVCSKTPNRVFS